MITGAYGYLGALLRARLDSAGWSTTALVRSPRPGDRAASWSLTDSPPDHALRGADVLIHCAYDFTPRRRSDIWRVNVDGSRVLLEAARRANVPRVLTVSSMSAYAGTGQHYGQAKLAIEELTRRDGGIAIRPGLVYGDSPGGMVGALRRLTKLPLIPVLGPGARQFPVHEDDLAAAVVRILDAADWRPETFGIAQSAPVSFPDLLTALNPRAGRRLRFIPVPWQAVYGMLRLVELTGAVLPLRADSVLGLVRAAAFVPPSRAFPDLPDMLRPLAPTGDAEGAARP